MRQKILGYFVIASFVFFAIDTVITQKLDNRLGDGGGDIPLVLALMIAGFILYAAYILWDNELR